jgi:hypothetical protein
VAPIESRGVNRAFWAGKRVLLTGHTGFKGAWLTLWLQSMGAALTGYSNLVPTEPSLFELARVGEGMESVEGDVRDPEALAAALAAADPEVVIHMAAQRRGPAKLYRLKGFLLLVCHCMILLIFIPVIAKYILNFRHTVPPFTDAYRQEDSWCGEC